MSMETAPAPPEFTELDAALLYIRMVNELDPEPFIARLSPTVQYVSHWVIEELHDAERVAELLRGKVRHLSAKHDRSQSAKLGVATTYDYGRPLAVLLEGHKPEATVDFKVCNGHVTAIGIMVLGAHAPQRLEKEDVERFRIWYLEHRGAAAQPRRR